MRGDDNGQLVESVRFAPQAAIARPIGRGGRLRDNALEAQLAGMAADKLAVANLMAIELQTGNVGNDRFEQRLPLDKREDRSVAAVEIKEVEGVKDRAHAAPPIGRGLGLSELGSPSSPTPHNSPSR
jgi:hypothetical protein